MQPLTLHELNSLVRSAIEGTLSGSYWITAELSEVRTAAGGHCYVEFVEKDVRGNGLVAKARGIVWRNVYALLAADFECATGHPLAPGMKVMVQVEVSFHELYGYSLRVTDIDPAYTLGDMARRRLEILSRLEADGVLTLNKELPLPRPLRRIAVVSSGTAAGYGDFCHQLGDSPFAFETRLFPAVMQGDGVETSVIAALDRIAAEREQWDVVAIIRGGGAVSDLNGFDTYLLATNVAQFPLPVVTGIGHERDDTVLDIVAHTRCKTPTAVAAFFIQAMQAELDLVHETAGRLHAAAEHRLRGLRRRFETAARRFHTATIEYGGRERGRLLRLAARMELCNRRRIDGEHARLESAGHRLVQAVARGLEIRRNRLALLGTEIAAASPERILRMGYSLTLFRGKAVRDAARLKAGDEIVTRLATGETTSIVK